MLPRVLKQEPWGYDPDADPYGDTPTSQERLAHLQERITDLVQDFLTSENFELDYITAQSNLLVRDDDREFYPYVRLNIDLIDRDVKIVQHRSN